MTIPKIFHQIWIGEKKYPKIFRDYAQTWIDLHPDWEYKLWTNDNLPPLIHQNLFDNAEEIVLKTNMLRIELLFKYGGVYVDADFECYKNIEPLLTENIKVFSCGEENGIIGNAIIGGEKLHRTWLVLMDGWAKSIKENEGYPPTIETGVVYTTRRLKIGKDIYLFPTKYFFPTATETESPMGMGYYFPEAYANHHWAATWVTEETKTKWKEWLKNQEPGRKWYENS